MIRRTGFILILALLTSALNAQTENRDTVTNAKSRVIIDASGAWSIAMGKYQTTKTTDEYAGYASGGFMAQVGINWIGKHELGLGVTYVFQHNGFQEKAENICPPGQDYLGSGGWNNHYFLAGPVYIKEFGRISMDISVLGGFVLSTGKIFSLEVPDTLHPYVSTGTGFGFGFQAKAYAGYRISNKVFITAGISYLGGTPSRSKSFYTLVQDPNVGWTYVGSETVIKKKISTINPGVGIMIKL